MASTFNTSTAARRPATFAALAVAAATALATFSSLPALAQPASPAPAAATVAADAPAAPVRPQHLRPAPQRERMQAQSKEQRMERWQQHRTERMAQFKAQLQLTPAQEPAWTDFTAAMQPGPRHARLEGHEGMEHLTTPERIDRMRAMRIQRAAEADRRGDAVKAFYAALDAPQQKTFDQQMHRVQERMHQSHAGGSDAKHQRAGREAQGPGARGARHRGAHHHRHGMQHHPQDGAGNAVPAAPAQ